MGKVSAAGLALDFEQIAEEAVRDLGRYATVRFGLFRPRPGRGGKRRAQERTHQVETRRAGRFTVIDGGLKE